MFENIENLKLISASEGKVIGNRRVDNKKLHSFIIRTSGATRYIFDNKVLEINEGELLFLPKGSSYYYNIIPEKECRYVSISFDADISDTSPCVFPLDNIPTDDIENSFVGMWKLGHPTDKHKCYAMFYTLLSYLSNAESLSYSDKKKFEIIEPAIEYLNSRIFDCALKIEDLHAICNISDTYFRKIFSMQYGCTPQAYVSNKRLSYAKNLLESEGAESVADISLSVGYSDPLYFSRIFKKKYGSAPTKL